MEKIKELIGKGNYALLKKILVISGAIAVVGVFFSMFHIRMVGFEMSSYDFGRNSISVIILSMIFSVSLLTYLLSIWLSSIKVVPSEDEIIVKDSDLKKIALVDSIIIIAGLYLYDKMWEFFGIKLHILSSGYLLIVCLLFSFLSMLLISVSFIKVAKRINGKV